jgi:hypothetical protein
MTFREKLDLWILGCGVTPEQVFAAQPSKGLQYAVEDEDPIDTMRELEYTILQNLPPEKRYSLRAELITSLQKLQFLQIMGSD